ncbi:MAG: hypothetical protein GX361_00410 [Bacteroidales bacterium]|nr:hypothetical protein [Bacteroidales bacterium]
MAIRHLEVTIWQLEMVIRLSEMNIWQLEMAIRRSDMDIRHQISISTPEIRGFADKMIHL